MYRIEQALSSRINILQEHGLMEHTNIKQYRSELFYECFIHVYSGLTHNMNNCANLRKLYGDGDTLLQLCLNKTLNLTLVFLEDYGPSVPTCT